MSVMAITNDNFETEIGVGNGVAMLDFWASWCGPCMMLGPVIEELADEFDGKVLVGKVNVDENRDLAVRFGVMSIPTVVIFKDGKEINRTVGVQSKQKIASMLESAD